MVLAKIVTFFKIFIKTMEKLLNIIRESVLQVLSEEDVAASSGVVDAHGKSIRTGRMVRPMDKADKRWGQIAGVTIDLKINVKWTDPESRHTGKTKSAVDPKTVEMY